MSQISTWNERTYSTAVNADWQISNKMIIFILGVILCVIYRLY